jgi:heat shock protein HslJ
MKKHPVLLWIVMGIVAFACVFAGVYMTLRVFFGDPKSLPPTAIPSLTSLQPTQTPLPTATRVVATVIPGLTSSPTVMPSATLVPPTAKTSPTATVVSPTVKPSATATVVPPTIKASATNLPPTAVPTINPIQNIIWQWLTVTQLPTGVQTTIPNTGSYTISFYPDGSLSGVADCNTFGGTYSQSNGFLIRIGASTSTFCGEGSLDQEYLQLLGDVVAGGPDGSGNLALETAGGEQRMVFANGGAVVKP